MCLAVPGKVIEIDGDTALVDYGGVLKKAKISLVTPDVGDFVMVHAGFAIQIVDEDMLKSIDAVLGSDDESYGR
ncbi:MAG: HypC/HybG/HupF family hydrogenase formation chaperone [archaeon]|nr:HypC/HybG/HupF family hydrogenase formation chaperone [archaeon]